MNKRIVFLGTPYVAVEFLKELVNNNLNISGVVTQPDKPYGRSKVITPPPVKNFALERNIDVYQPSTSQELKNVVKKINPDLGIVVAYGRILKKDVIEIPHYGFYNIHFSLLPKYRGADPVRAVILNREKETGVTIFKIDEGLDSGPILLQQKIEISGDDTSTILFQKLIEKGKKMMLEAINIILSDNFKLKNQEGEPSYAGKLKTEDTFIDFHHDIEIIYAKIRAFSFDPYARFYYNLNGKKILIQIISAKIIRDDKSFNSFLPSSICGFEKNKGILVKCDKGILLIEKIKPEGKNIVNAYDYFVNGLKSKIGDRI